jgi:dTDP-4-amino-4,6-dideoxygalactose transaminase
VKLPYVERWNARRRAIAERYRSLLAGVPELVLPAARPDVEHCYNYFTLRVLGGRRDAVQQELGKRGIGTAVYYPQPLHQSSLYSARAVHLPHAERAAAEVLSLPIWPEMPDDAIERVAREVRSTLGG